MKWLLRSSKNCGQCERIYWVGSSKKMVVSCYMCQSLEGIAFAYLTAHGDWGFMLSLVKVILYLVASNQLTLALLVSYVPLWETSCNLETYRSLFMLIVLLTPRKKQPRGMHQTKNKHLYMLINKHNWSMIHFLAPLIEHIQPSPMSTTMVPMQLWCSSPSCSVARSCVFPYARLDPGPPSWSSNPDFPLSLNSAQKLSCPASHKKKTSHSSSSISSF